MLANATDLFANLDQSMPKFNEWLQARLPIVQLPVGVSVNGNVVAAAACVWPDRQCRILSAVGHTRCSRYLYLALHKQESMGINATATLEEYDNIWLPMPSNTTNGASP